MLVKKEKNSIKNACRDGVIGSRTCLRSKREQSHGSSSLPPGTP